MRLILFGGFSFRKIWTNMEKRPFFQAATAVSFGEILHGRLRPDLGL